MSGKGFIGTKIKEVRLQLPGNRGTVAYCFESEKEVILEKKNGKVEVTTKAIVGDKHMKLPESSSEEEKGSHRKQEMRSPRKEEPRTPRKEESKRKRLQVEICVGVDVSEGDGFKRLRERFEDRNIQLTTKYSERVQAFISENVNSKSAHMRMRGIKHYKPKVLSHIKDESDAISLGIGHHDYEEYLMHPLSGLYFYLDAKSLNDDLLDEQKDIIQSFDGELTKERDHADYIIVDPKNERHDHKKNISYQGVYHLVGTYGGAQFTTVTKDFTKPYAEQKLLLEGVESRLKEGLTALVNFSESEALQARRFYIDTKISKSSKLYKLIKVLRHLVENMFMEEVKYQEEAEIIFTPQIKNDKESRKLVGSKQCVFVSPAWMFDSLFVGRCLPFSDYMMVELKEHSQDEEDEDKMSERAPSQRSYKSQRYTKSQRNDYSDEDEKETQENTRKSKKDSAMPDYYIDVDSEDLEDEMRRRIVRLKGKVAPNKSMSQFIICNHGSVSDAHYEWKVSAERSDVRYLTPEYINYCLEQRMWVPPMTTDLCHMRAIPCKLPIKDGSNVVVYISGDGPVKGSKEALMKTIEILGLQLTKKLKDATHFIPLMVTDKLAKLVARKDDEMEVPIMVSEEWVEYIANQGKLPKSPEEFPVMDEMIRRSRQYEMED